MIIALPCGCVLEKTRTIIDNIRLENGASKIAHLIVERKCEKCKEYVRRRNALIPTALAKADAKCSKRYADMTEEEMALWSMNWNKTFHTTMNKLAKEAGL